MNSDETPRQDVTPVVPSPVATGESPPEAAAATAIAPDAPGEAIASTNGAATATPEHGAPPGETERPRVRLNPTIHESAARPIPAFSTAPPAIPAPAPAIAAPPMATAPAEPASTVSSEMSDPEPPRRPASASGVDIPPSSDLDAAMAAEIDAAMASGELNLLGAPRPEVPAAEGATAKPTEETLERGTKLTGKINSIHADDVFLDLGFRMNGVVQARQFDANKKPAVGQMIEVLVDKVDAENGLIVCNLPRSTRKPGGNWDALSVGQIVDCVVNKTNKGGLEVTISNLRGFLPAGQVDLGFVQNLESFIGQKLRVQVTEVNPKKRNLVVSRRVLLIEERKETEETLWKTLEVGQKFSGKVKTIKDYGAFVDIGGADGFLHIGEISWTRLKHPSEVLSEGQPVEVAVVTLDREKKRIGLGMRQLSQNPWSVATSKYAVGTTVSGVVTRTADFGAFVQLEPGLEGLIHISEMDHKRIHRVTDVVKEGQAVEAKVLEVDPDRKRISLSLKALKDRPEEPKKADEDLAPSGGEAYVAKRKGPLKGGTGGDKPGGLFGNPRDFGRGT